jgi:hypothetical protein
VPEAKPPMRAHALSRGASLGRAMLFMLVDTPDPRHWGGFDPDEERKRRWEPISRRLFVPAAGSVSCLVLSPSVGSRLASWALVAGGVALCADFVRVSLRDVPQRDKRASAAGDERE